MTVFLTTRVLMSPKKYSCSKAAFRTFLTYSFISYVFFFCILGCHYRFSNRHLSPPKGIQRIAVETIYDTSEHVIPHEILWMQLQKQLIIDGRLDVCRARNADAYLRAHIVSFQRTLENPHISQRSEPYPYFPVDPNQQNLHPHPLEKFPNLRAADHFAKNEHLHLCIDVEIWNLRTHRNIFQRYYCSQEAFPMFCPESPTSETLLKYDERFQDTFTKICERIASDTVRDFMTAG